jgi:glyoxylase-like metal-dependent hydrolase (beta-lactamase superfamily II)
MDIISIPLGFDQCYLISGDGVVAVDAGAPKKAGVFLRALESANIKPDDLHLVVLTHGHWDHIGSAAEIKAMTGAKIAMHRSEVSWLEDGLKPLSPGVTAWGKFLTALHKVFMPFIRVPATSVDIVLDDDAFPLMDYGIPGRILHTPGHSSGSVTLLLDSGDAFVGDLAMNRFPLRLSPGLPIFAEDPGAVLRSWQFLLEQGATMIYPAHGKPFPASVIKNALLQRTPQNR